MKIRHHLTIQIRVTVAVTMVGAVVVVRMSTRLFVKTLGQPNLQCVLTQYLCRKAGHMHKTNYPERASMANLRC
ncbi:hypothetical protein CVO74_16175 [Xanthomonas prunicola]|uniref:Uncharacterized protein n=1 Tax=Xanthomonas prunicola TaxID=2053930 RepID=A0A2N3RH04_9XANT|nr:hypothetical protein XpruCFBP8353_16380 [Xanthomonas prunicola]PKV16010.1 hypothetical protein XpruCFBP8354_16045 [Xanthomonas prunicola]PKV20273.1 hypothetical protein CVO74_16175 [Xanthomonas prunicola]